MIVYVDYFFSFKVRGDVFQCKYRCMYNTIDVHIIVLFDLMTKAIYSIYPVAAVHRIF